MPPRRKARTFFGSSAKRERTSREGCRVEQDSCGSPGGDREYRPAIRELAPGPPHIRNRRAHLVRAKGRRIPQRLLAARRRSARPAHRLDGTATPRRGRPPGARRRRGVQRPPGGNRRGRRNERRPIGRANLLQRVGSPYGRGRSALAAGSDSEPPPARRTSANASGRRLRREASELIERGPGPSTTAPPGRARPPAPTG